MPPADDGHLEVSMCCLNPRCNDDREDHEYKMWINLDSGVYVCYRCDEKGGVVKFVMKVLSCGFTTALRLLKGSINPADLNLMSLTLHNEEIVMETEDEDKEIELPYSYEQIKGPLPYLAERGVPWELAMNLGWGISKAGYTKDRIIVPTFQKDRVVFWQARDILNKSHPDYGDKKKYRKVLNPKGVSARKVLYNYDNAKKYKKLVLVEGFMDCVKVGMNCMATNGKKLHARQVELLISAGVEEVTLMWDRDSYTDGKRDKETKQWVKHPSAIKAGMLLSSVLKVKYAVLPDKRDPGDYNIGSKELKAIINEAKELKL